MRNPVLSRGFVVQNTVMPLDLCESKNYLPILFIVEEKKYAVGKKRKRFCLNQKRVVFWEYYDKDRLTFEDTIFKTYESQMFQEMTDLSSRMRKYLKLCRIMYRCAEFDEAKRIYLQISTAFERFDQFLLSELLETVCLNAEMVLFIFNIAGRSNQQLLKRLLQLSKAQSGSFQSDWQFAWDLITDDNIICQYFIKEQYASIPILLRHGLQWRYCESLYMEYCKVINFSWTWEMIDLTNCDYEESAGRSKHRFFLILQTFFTIYKQRDDQHRMEALHLLWRSIPDAVISREEIVSSLEKFTTLDEESLQICLTAVWWETEHPPGARSLKHLARCAVRQQLANNFQLPCDNLTLDIPHCLIPYINLDESTATTSSEYYI